MFYSTLYTAPGGAANRTEILRRNGVNTALVLFYGSSATSVNDTTTIIPVKAGDVIDWLDSPAGSPAASPIVISMLFTPSDLP